VGQLHVERPAIFSYVIGAGALRNRENAAVTEDPCDGNLRRGGVPPLGEGWDSNPHSSMHGAGTIVGMLVPIGSKPRELSLRLSLSRAKTAPPEPMLANSLDLRSRR
jgi:hypothetical protein